jgi:hypothetical protein
MFQLDEAAKRFSKECSSFFFMESNDLQCVIIFPTPKQQNEKKTMTSFQCTLYVSMHISQALLEKVSRLFLFQFVCNILSILKVFCPNFIAGSVLVAVPAAADSVSLGDHFGVVEAKSHWRSCLGRDVLGGHVIVDKCASVPDGATLCPQQGANDSMEIAATVQIDTSGRQMQLKCGHA